MRALDKIDHAGEVAAAVAVVVFTAFTALVTTPVRAQDANGLSLSDCPSEQGLTYLCGFVLPEDVVNVGSTGLVLASGHRAPGHMYLIDAAAGTWSELIHSAAFRFRHDTSAYPECPGPLNLEAFDVHGISLAETSPGRFRIYTTSHGEREAIEIYELDLRGDARGAAPVLAWTGCVLLQQDGYFNAVAQLANGGFVTTRMRDRNASTDSVRGTISGRVFEWHPGGQLQPVAGTELSLPNGIEVSADGRYLYVAASGTQEFVRFDRRATPIGKRAVSTPMGPDNIHRDGNGKLLIAGPNRADPAACDGPPCRAGWTVIEVDPQTLAVSRLGGADGTAAMQRASAAIRVGNEIWVGSNEDRIARFPVNAQVPREASFDIRINISDQHELHLAATVRNGTTHRLEVDGDLGLRLELSEVFSWGGRWVNAFIVETGNGTDRDLALLDWPIRPEEPAHVQSMAFSVCGDRIIALRDAPPGRCADLQPAAEPDPLYGQCGVAGNNCLGPYEEMPSDFTSEERIAPESEPGEPLRITGRVLGQDGTPRPGIIVYAYQTDRNGVYPPVYPPRSSASNYHGRLRGWVRSDDQGYYAFETIRPGDYGGNPEHVHMHIVEPGCAAYIIDDLIFADDPNLLLLTKEQRESTWPGRGGSGVGTLLRAADGWEVVRDIHLGEKVSGYQSCEAG